jgi:4-diphosphocytidyl-2-C-methyl-D-erythritol kinase
MAAPGAARMRGLGERVEPVPDLPGLWLVLVNPGAPLATPAVFRALASPDNPPLPEAIPAFPDAAALVAWLAMQRNDLEGAARALEPRVGAALAALAEQPGCALARMTGSGATCFGLFLSRADRDRAAAALGRPGWFVAAAATLHAPPAG